MLKNPGFEQGDDWPDGWRVNAPGASWVSQGEHMVFRTGISPEPLGNESSLRFWKQAVIKDWPVPKEYFPEKSVVEANELIIVEYTYFLD